MGMPASWNEFWDLYTEKTGFDPRKASCHLCPHARPVIGSMHLSCYYGGEEAFWTNAVAGPPTVDTEVGMIPLVRMDPQAVKLGFVVWPLSIDPAWLWWCTLFYMNEKGEFRSNEQVGCSDQQG